MGARFAWTSLCFEEQASQMSTTNTLPRTISPMATSSRFDTSFVAHMAREALAILLTRTSAAKMLPSCTRGGKNKPSKLLCDSVGICSCSPATQWAYSCRNSFNSVMKCVFPVSSSLKAVDSTKSRREDLRLVCLFR